MYKEEELYHVLKDATLAVGAGAPEADGVNAKRPGVFMEVLKDRQRFTELY